MKERSRGYVHYWRNSLADAALGRGGFSRSDLTPYLELDGDVLAAGRLPADLTGRLFHDAPAKVESIDVVLRPWLLQVRLEHGQRRSRGIPEYVTPIRTTARLMRDGRLYPQGDAVIPRDLLEPVERGAFALGTMEDLDDYLTTHHLDAVTAIVVDDKDEAAAARFQHDWERYLQDCRDLLDKVGLGFPGDKNEFLAMDHGLLLPESSVIGASQHILHLYDHLRESEAGVPLFDTYAEETGSPPEPCLSAHAGFAARLGHASDSFPLADAQRDALTHLLAMKHGDILAVNGPPGTGKTTMLLSVVATLWANAALQGGEPPVIVAASTNNQAVTNVIDAFGKDFSSGSGSLAGRWLPDIQSFGAYFPATSKESESGGKYQTRAFFDRIESLEYVEHAEAAYMTAGQQVFPELSTPDVKTIVAQLRGALQREADKLIAIESAWASLAKSRSAVLAELGEDPIRTITQWQEQAQILDVGLQRYARLLHEWETWRANESVFYALFAWLPPVAKRRLLRARLFLRQAWPQGNDKCSWTNLDHIDSTLRTQLAGFRQAADALRQRLQAAEGLKETVQQALGRWAEALKPLNVQNVADTSLADVDVLADTQIRFQAFLMANHYWEGRWLLDMRELGGSIQSDKGKTGRVAMQDRWRRRMKLTPCVVSTFFMLPRLMKVDKFVERNTFTSDYLYDFANLLIVDEAGQVLPEVAGASFALAQKALVIGDTLQIEPIWSIPSQVDIGNLIGAGLMGIQDHEQTYRRLTDLGKTVANGSVMRIAQQTTRYHYDHDLARGMFLYEHRRCFDEIIGYCNRLCYHGKLISRRGAKPVDAEGLPALGYLHIDGICEPGNGGSRQNRLEAETLAAWLVAHEGKLRAAYGDRPLAEIVGVVTPFGGQVGAITRACQARGIAVGGKDGMTVGTVHSLQGAERPVVIFSAVYSKHADGGFIDRSSSMLNVAVSRAKDSFLVFGDMDVFELSPRNQPRGLLAHELFSRSENALVFEYLPRPDLKTTAGEITTLRDAAEHDVFLLKLFAEVKHEVHLVTPWIIIERIQDIGAMEAMRDAVRRGVRIRVYTDPGWVTNGVDPAERQRQWLRLREAEQALQAEGVELLFVHRVHSKSLTGDKDVYCNGSFNWFSARRDGYANHETSFAYRGPALVKDIDALVASLQQRVARFQRERH